MSEYERQHHIAYRASADEFEVDFFGGPLDGAQISIDVFPDCEIFVHRVHNRNYSYRYKKISSFRFQANWDPEATNFRPPASRNRFARSAVVATLMTLLALAAAIAIWSLLGS